MTTLRIDTRNNAKNVVSVLKNGRDYTVSSENQDIRAEVTLLLIEKALEASNVSLVQIDTVEVMCGPGSFTGLRVGVSIANSLSFALLCPINNKPVGSLELPVYS